MAPALLAQRLGSPISSTATSGSTVTRARTGGAKALTVVGSALAGGDSIDDCDVLRSGPAGEVFDDVRAPSTIGTWPRAFAWAGVRQLDGVTRRLLRRAWAAGLGPDLAADAES